MNSPQTRWLGQSSTTPVEYSPDILEPIPRAPAHRFEGEDRWFLYELSWLTPSGRPEFRSATLTIPATSPAMVESKSLKLYLNSLNHAFFESCDLFAERVIKDLIAVVGAIPLWEWGTPERLALMDDGQEGSMTLFKDLKNVCLDTYEILKDEIISSPETARVLLKNTDKQNSFLGFTRLFRSLCPVTGQPDWARVSVRCSGEGPKPSALLSYLLSYRNHACFHEQCVENICADLWQICDLSDIEITAFFMPRGGISINPRRSLRQP